MSNRLTVSPDPCMMNGQQAHPGTQVSTVVLTLGWLTMLGWVPMPGWMASVLVAITASGLLLTMRRAGNVRGPLRTAFSGLVLGMAGWGLLAGAMVRMTPAELLSYLADSQWDFIGHAVMVDHLMEHSHYETTAFGDPGFPYADYPQGGAFLIAAVLRPLVWVGVVEPASPQMAGAVTLLFAAMAAWLLALPAACALHSASDWSGRLVPILVGCSFLALGPFGVLLAYGHVNFLLAIGLSAAVVILVEGIVSERGQPQSLPAAVALSGGLVAIAHVYPSVAVLVVPLAVVGGWRLWKGAPPSDRRWMSAIWVAAVLACGPQAVLTMSTVARFADTQAGLGGPVSMALLIVSVGAVMTAAGLSRTARWSVFVGGVGLLLAAALAQLALVGDLGYYTVKWQWGVALLFCSVAAGGLRLGGAFASMAVGSCSLLVFGASGPLTPLFSEYQSVPSRLNISYLGASEYPSWPGNMLLACEEALSEGTRPAVAASDPSGHPRAEILSMWLSYLRSSEHGPIWSAIRTQSQVQARGYSTTDSLAYAMTVEQDVSFIAEREIYDRMNVENPALRNAAAGVWDVNDGAVTCWPS